MKIDQFNTLKRIMQLSTSNNDAEALAALRKANAILAEAGVDWSRVFERCVTVVAEYESDPEQESSGSRDKDRTVEINEAFADVEKTDPRGASPISLRV